MLFSNLPPVFPTRLRFVFSNLLSNNNMFKNCNTVGQPYHLISRKKKTINGNPGLENPSLERQDDEGSV